MDEIFKGTNTIERISGGKAMLFYRNKANNMVLVSIHDIKLTELLRKEKFELFHEIVEDAKITERITFADRTNKPLPVTHDLKKSRRFSNGVLYF